MTEQKHWWYRAADNIEAFQQWCAAAFKELLGYVLVIGLALWALYGLVKFVHWAWDSTSH